MSDGATGWNWPETHVFLDPPVRVFVEGYDVRDNYGNWLFEAPSSPLDADGLRTYVLSRLKEHKLERLKEMIK